MFKYQLFPSHEQIKSEINHLSGLMRFREPRVTQTLNLRNLNLKDLNELRSLVIEETAQRCKDEEIRDLMLEHNLPQTIEDLAILADCVTSEAVVVQLDGDNLEDVSNEMEYLHLLEEVEEGLTAPVCIETVQQVVV